MSTLKSLVARSNEGLSFGKKCKQGFGLGDFLAATTEQMLMTRGGYGSPYGYYSGPASWWDPFGGAGGSSSADSGTGGQHFYEWGLGAQGVGSDQSSSEGSSLWSQYGDKVIMAAVKKGITSVFGKGAGQIFRDGKMSLGGQFIIRNDSIIGSDGSYRGPANFRVLK
jgi:hypothetical protein